MAHIARIKNANGQLEPVEANNVHEKSNFYCACKDCTAEMILVSVGEREAHFRSRSRSAHKYAECLRNDITFDSDRYDKDLFRMANFLNRLMNSPDTPSIHEHLTGRGGRVGTGNRIAPNTLKSIYAAYVESLRPGASDIIGDSRFSDFMRCKENYMDFVNNPDGFYILETTFYYRVKGENAFLLNVPMYIPGEQSFHVKVNFTDSADFDRVFKHFNSISKPYKCIVLIAGEWHPTKSNSDYIAECTIYKSSQHVYISG